MYVCMHACMYVLFTQVITFELIVPMYKLANNTLLLKSFASMQSLWKEWLMTTGSAYSSISHLWVGLEKAVGLSCAHTHSWTKGIKY
jgi:hypothetical protein